MQSNSIQSIIKMFKNWSHRFFFFFGSAMANEKWCFTKMFNDCIEPEMEPKRTITKYYQWNESNFGIAATSPGTQWNEYVLAKLIQWEKPIKKQTNIGILFTIFFFFLNKNEIDRSNRSHFEWERISNERPTHSWSWTKLIWYRIYYCHIVIGARESYANKC